MNQEIQFSSQILIEKLSTKEVFTRILTSPKTAFEYIHKNHFEKYFVILLGLAGISRAFDSASIKNLGDDLPLIAVLAICIIGGALLGWISLYIWSALLSWTGKWIKGKGDTNSIYRIVAYSMIPTIFAILLVIPQVIIMGNGLFQSEQPEYAIGIGGAVILMGVGFIEIGLSIWSLILLIHGLVAVQEFSFGKAILNFLIPLVLFGIPLYVLTYLSRGL